MASADCHPVLSGGCRLRFPLPLELLRVHRGTSTELLGVYDLVIMGDTTFGFQKTYELVPDAPLRRCRGTNMSGHRLVSIWP